MLWSKFTRKGTGTFKKNTFYKKNGYPHVDDY